MGHIVITPAGTYRANWRDPTGRQRAKTFKTKRAASAYLAEVEAAVNHGIYVNPHAGRVTFAEFSSRWLAGRCVEARTVERTVSLMRTHLLPQWGRWPLSRIDHLAVQEWVTGLSQTLAPATVRKCHGLLLGALKTAVRARYLSVNPAEGIKLPVIRSENSTAAIISRADFFGKLLPAAPLRYRAMFCAAAGAGLRWGECAGLVWAAVDLEKVTLRVVQVAVETPTEVVLRPYPKTRASTRTVPMPAFLVTALQQHRDRLSSDPDDRDLVFGSRLSGPLRRSNFRRRIWLPSLVRAGLLGRVEHLGEHKYRATWPDRTGIEWTAEFTTEREAIAYVAARAKGGLRFHDLRHSYATWLITEGVPVNVVQRVMGHQQASTTLNRYTHAPGDYQDRVRSVFADDSLTTWDESGAELAPEDDADEL